MVSLKTLFLFLLGIVLITACQTDTVEPAPETIRQVVSAEDIPEVTSTLLNRMGLSNSTGKFSMNNGTIQSEFDIDWDKILQLIDTTGRETYTFGIKDNDGSPFTFYNLVIRFNEFGDAYFPFLMKYEMSEDFIPQYLATGSLQNFSGKITKQVVSMPASGNNQHSYNADPDAPRMVNGNPNCPQDEINMNDGNGNSGGGGPGGPGGPIGGGNGGGYTVYEVCDYYIHDEFWISSVCDANGENCTVSDIEVTSVITEECYTVTVNHTETPGSPNCDTGNGDTPILDPNDECEILQLDANTYVNTCEETFANDVLAFLQQRNGYNIDGRNIPVNPEEVKLIKRYPRKALIMYHHRIEAEFVTEQKFGYNGVDDCSDAFRHAYFMP